MIFASVRKDFKSTTDLAPLQLQRVDGSSISLFDIVRMAADAGNKVDILIHGYHNGFDGAAKAYTKIDQKLAEADIDGLTIGFFWPGSWATLGFSMAVGRAKRAGIELAQLIKFLTFSGIDVTVETHSLGARVVLSALLEGAQPNRIILTGAAVDHNTLKKEFNNRPGVLIHSLYSTNDGVLKFAYRVFNWFTSALGCTPGALSNLYMVYEYDRSKVVKNHSDYKDDPVLYQKSFWRS